ncbi:unnamed protein product, partial [Sphagnum compactum]
MENLGKSSTSMEESLFDFMHAEHAPSSSNKGGGTTTHGYKSAVAGPVFDFGNDDLLPSFEFQPAAEASKSTTTQQVDDRTRRNLSPSPLWNNPSHDQSGHPAGRESVEWATVVATVERTMKKYADNLLHVLEGMSGRLSQLEFNSQRIEYTVGKLKVESADHHGAADGKLRSLENMVKEVQRGVQVLRDKQGIVEEQLKLAKLQHDGKMEAPHSQQLQVQAMPLTLQLEPHYQPQTLSQPLQSQPQQQAHQQLPPQHSQQVQLQATPQTSLPEPQYQPQALPQPQSQPQQLTHPIPQQQPPGKYSSEKVPAYLPEGYGNRPFPQPLPQTQQHSPNLSSDQTYDLSGNNRGGQSALPPPYHPGRTTPPVYETYAPFGYQMPSSGTNPLTSHLHLRNTL